MCLTSLLQGSAVFIAYLCNDYVHLQSFYFIYIYMYIYNVLLLSRYTYLSKFSQIQNITMNPINESMAFLWTKLSCHVVFHPYTAIKKNNTTTHPQPQYHCSEMFLVATFLKTCNGGFCFPLISVFWRNSNGLLWVKFKSMQTS